ncbi:TOBE domain-containing protein [Campylobacter novaezeelandiae]|uniref:TOBE domain-containing protein n=1 Tax=Campylobacter novaezeelandiae TaxID=2267891 RepID=UPI0019063774|nr:molybdenum-pterin-binding protein [Campylobacter novaezeelandiae]MBK1963440.1 molybdenum-pterin-binding protein [Campylobacter novaezeelandiae]MBK1994228.1 molybdenum-pterin-binding protein [Campylobacter novaezeelandiae]
MNILKGKVLDIFHKDDIVMIRINVKNEIFSVLMLDFNSLDHLRPNSYVELLFKEHELCFGELNAKISIENTFKAKLIKIKKGEILWHIFFDFKGFLIGSIISAKKAKELNLNENEEKLCFVKANDIILRT